MLLFLVISRLWAQIRIVSPVALAGKFDGPPQGSLSGSTATFGAPYYGERVLGKLIYKKPLDNKHPHCHVSGFADADKLKRDASKEVNDTKLGESRVKHDPKDVFIVRRGGCSFVTKVKLAQEHFGAHAVIVVDKEQSPLTSETIMTVIMADDGYGKAVNIPSILISHEDGKKLITAVKDSTVLVELEWDVPANDIVVMDMWMSSSSKIANQFIKDFKTIGEALLYNLQFVPHYYIYELASDFNSFCFSETEHRFCADDPDMEGPLTGRDVVNEDLRQICIWEVTAEGSSKSSEVKLETKLLSKKEVLRSQQYWEYLQYILDWCPLDGSLAENKRFGSKECAETVMKHVGIDVSQVDYCVQHMGTSLLEHQLNNVAWAPLAIRVNGWRYAGQIERDLVAKAVCSGFTKPPEICSKVMDPSITIYTTEWTWKQVLYVSVISVLVILCLAQLYTKKFFHRYFRRVLQEEVMLEVQNAMADYKMLEEDDSFSRDGGHASRIGRLPRWN